ADIFSATGLLLPTFSGTEECNELAEKHETVLQILRKEQGQLAVLTTKHVLDPHSHLFDEKGKLKHPNSPTVNPVYAILLGMIFEARLLGIAAALQTMLQQVVLLEQRRTKARIWPPTGVRNAAAWVFSKSLTPGVPTIGENPNMAEEKPSKGTKNRREKEPGA
ncbi:hypothetical protein LTR16_004441, partial [Cryomyces antarcticus]